ncbi:MAG: SDR family oxidoreductase [Bdellovibrionaceae bacterium]|nr:SDR family oxidoreductase [Pseudobdellovibrionaceae bacterium]
MAQSEEPISTSNTNEALSCKTPTLAEVERCLEILNYYLEDPLRLSELSKQQRIDLMIVAGRLSRPTKLETSERNRRLQKKRRKEKFYLHKELRAQTGIRKARERKIFEAPEFMLPSREQEPIRLKSPQNCYVCKEEYTHLHHFYDSMCPRCADLNYKKRFQSAPLHGRVAVITGSRLKIGYQATLMLLRAGARVIATTRFPHDSALRFSREKDFAEWGERLQIYGLDLRHTPSVEIFCSYLKKSLDRLDILINNAAQTVRRPPGFYAHLMDTELLPLSDLPSEAQKLLHDYAMCRGQLSEKCAPVLEDNTKVLAQWQWQGPGIGLRAPAQLSQIPYSYDGSLKAEDVFPSGQLDVDLQQVDLRTTNSWRLRIADVPGAEMLEVQLVNAVAPFILCSQLAPIMRRDYTGEKHIVNVTAMEGKFYRFHKEDRHPHTNMAKAALNMLTHTSASDLAKDGIYMNAVDTGWVTDEDPAVLAQMKSQTHDFQPPLDIVDGAARVCDPFFDGILTGKHWSGRFLKDYFPIDW